MKRWYIRSGINAAHQSSFNSLRCGVHEFSIKNIFYDKMDFIMCIMWLFYVYVKNVYLKFNAWCPLEQTWNFHLVPSYTRH